MFCLLMVNIKSNNEDADKDKHNNTYTNNGMTSDTCSRDPLPFRVALAGENFRVKPEEFDVARARLGRRLIHYGYAESEARYARLLWDADIVLSTAIHEFFGVSVVEAIYCGCQPVLPNRLSYPELVPVSLHELCLYDGFDDLVARLAGVLTHQHLLPELGHSAHRELLALQVPRQRLHHILQVLLVVLKDVALGRGAGRSRERPRPFQDALQGIR